MPGRADVSILHQWILSQSLVSQWVQAVGRDRRPEDSEVIVHILQAGVFRIHPGLTAEPSVQLISPILLFVPSSLVITVVLGILHYLLLVSLTRAAPL